MDVRLTGQIASVAYSAYASNTKAKAGTADTAADKTAANVGDAYSVDISEAAKKASSAAGSEAQATAKENDGAANATATKADSEVQAAEQKQGGEVKGLTSDEINALKSATEKSYALMIQTMTEHNNKLQGWVDDGIGKLNFGGLEIDTSRFALPEVATTPEEAAAAVAEGGDWSVSAVSDRIFGLATALAGDNPEMLEKMRAAVEDGFAQAGVAFKEATGAKDMPQITKDTYAEIMKRFDDRSGQLSGTTATVSE